MNVPKPVIHFLSLFFPVLFFFPARSAAQHQRCAAGQDRPATPEQIQQREAREQALARWLQSYEEGLTQRSVVTIPVVVHVVWNKNEENISDAQILSQIAVLNKDFRALNVEVPGIPAVFQDRVADVEFEFCLANKDPNGLPTPGITRTYTDNSAGIGGTVNIHHTSMGGKNAWAPEKYLNIWVAKFSGGVGGTSSFPGQGPLAEDGVQIDYRQFGTMNVQPPYHLGRTCTHEIGHYFNLEHVWGPSINSCCNDDDFVTDTPNSCETYLGQCPSHPVVSCSQADMFMNYLFYTNDACMGMFSKGQKARMLATLNTLRTGLLTSDGCGLVPTAEAGEVSNLRIYQNPAAGRVAFEVESNLPGEWSAYLMDFTGKKLVSKTTTSNLRQTFDLENLPAGAYFLICENGGKRLSGKVVVR